MHYQTYEYLARSVTLFEYQPSLWKMYLTQFCYLTKLINGHNIPLKAINHCHKAHHLRYLLVHWIGGAKKYFNIVLENKTFFFFCK